MKTLINMTARELLVRTAGEDHAIHSIASRTLPKKNLIKIICSCDEEFEVAATEDNLKALRNVSVPEAQA